MCVLSEGEKGGGRLLIQTESVYNKVVHSLEVTTIRRTGTTLFFEMHVLDVLASIDFF